ncbi:MAG: sigma-70 family RNA polymerase sigma factor [Gemmataceae bacterium]
MHTGDSRLNQITTLWSELRVAHNEADAGQQFARERMLDRYSGAIFRYLLKALGDSEAAHDLHQEFAVRFLSGRLQGADPQQGRFRDYLKGVLYNLIAEHHHRRIRQERQLLEEIPEPAVPCALQQEQEEAFRKSWTRELLARTWANLQRHEQQTGQPFYTVLRYRADHPEQTSEQMAQALSLPLQRALSAANVRKLLERARSNFGNLLIEEVMQSLADPTPEDIAEELAELGLLEMVRKELEQRFIHL